MANAAPYIATPARRLAAGVVDLLLCFGLSIFGWGVVVSASNASTLLEVALLNKVPFLVYAGYHALCLWRFNGQTLGLYFLNIRVVRASGGGDLSLPQAALRGAFRPLLIYLFGQAAVAAQSGFGSVASIVAVPVLVDLGMMFTLSSWQTLSDIVCKTLVVNLPPPQPHRAPAGPMYSPTDAEFGVRPHRK
jgi:uncharacterized RDD family membrane protein YckC